MSGIVKTIKNFKKNPLKAIAAVVVVAAAVWFTAGMATAYFSAPGVTMGQAVSASWQSMTTTVTTGSWTSATSQLAAAGNTAGAASVGATAAEVGAVEVGAIAPELAPVATPLEATAAGGAAAGGPGGAAAIPGETALYADSIAGTMPAAADATAATAGSTVAAAPSAGGGGILKSAGAWMKENPIPTMILGSGLVGAYGSYKEDQMHEREVEARRERGLMGFDYGGTYQGGGIVSSQVKTPTVEQAVAEPTVQQPQVAVKRNNLPQLQKRVV